MSGDRAAQEAELEALYKQYPHLRPAPVPKRLMHQEVTYVERLQGAGRAAGAAETRLPRQVPPPFPHLRITNLDDPRGFLQGPPPRKIVEDVTPADGKGSSPMDQRLRGMERRLAQLEAENRALRGEQPAPVQQRPQQQQRPGITIEQMQEQWRRDAYQSARRSVNNADGSGWDRLGGGRG